MTENTPRLPMQPEIIAALGTENVEGLYGPVNGRVWLRHANEAAMARTCGMLKDRNGRYSVKVQRRMGWADMAWWRWVPEDSLDILRLTEQQAHTLWDDINDHFTYYADDGGSVHRETLDLSLAVQDLPRFLEILKGHAELAFTASAQDLLLLPEFSDGPAGHPAEGQAIPAIPVPGRGVSGPLDLGRDMGFLSEADVPDLLEGWRGCSWGLVRLCMADDDREQIDERLAVERLNAICSKVSESLAAGRIGAAHGYLFQYSDLRHALLGWRAGQV